MSQENETPNMRVAVRINPEKHIHARLEKLQNFIGLTEGTRPNKEQVCLRLIEKALEQEEAAMKAFITA